MSTALPQLDLRNDLNLSTTSLGRVRRSLNHAGPQYHVNMAPWSRRAQHPASTPWPHRSADYVIAIPITSDAPTSQPGRRSIPHINASQEELHAFLEELHNTHFFGRLDAEQRSSGDVRVLCSRGPAIYPREISSHSVANRRLEFGHHQVGNKFHICEGGLPVEAYSATTGAFAHDVKLVPGTLGLIASREPWTPELRQSNAVRRAEAALGRAIGEEYLRSIIHNVGRPAASPYMWHNTAIFIQSRDKWPEQDPAGNWSFAGKLRCCYFYDPSWPSEQQGPHNGPGQVTSMLNGPRPHSVRIRQLTFHANVRHLLLGDDGLLPSRGTGRNKKAWVKDVMKIGGGGNAEGLDACRRMSCVWIQQVAVLS